MIGGHKVGGQGQGIGHGFKSGEGLRLGVQVRGQGLGRGHGFRGQSLGSRLWSRSGVNVRGQGHGVKVRVMIGGHKVWGQGQASMLG